MSKTIVNLVILVTCLVIYASCATSGKCTLEKESGSCRGFFPSYFFNTASGTCEQFVYGGCGGNDNRFSTLDECTSACGNRK